jgi:hypothetical protein
MVKMEEKLPFSVQQLTVYRTNATLGQKLIVFGAAQNFEIKVRY